MQRGTNYCCSAQQSQSMSVSQSPDSAIASDDINVVNTNNINTGNNVGNTAGNQPNRVSLSPTNTRAPTTTTQQPPNRNTVVNPYLKQSPNNNDNTTQITIDPILKKKQEFIDRYHLQSLQHNNRGKRSDSVKSISALELHTNTQNWRHSWQQQQRLSCDNNNQVLSNHTVPLRPRLFLFRRHAEQQVQNTNGIQQQQQQQQQPEGIWELDTGITELSGEGGSGKTQICLSTCVTCVMTPLLYPTPSSSVTGNNAPNTTAPMNSISNTQRNQQQNINNHYTSIYITMGEGIPPASIARRLEQMVRTRLYQKGDCNTTNSDGTDNQVKDILSRIGLLSIRNEEEFVEFVEVDLPRILAQQKQQQNQQRTNNPYLRQQQQQHTTQTTKIGLIAFDGIAGFFRFSDPTYQHSRNSMFHFQRSSKLLQVSSQLRKLSNVFDVPILITNQVTASIPPTVAGGNGSSSFDMVSASMLATSSQGGHQRTLPALGLIWSNCVSTRFILQRKDGATFSLDDNVGNNVEQQQNIQQSVAGGEKSQKQTVKKKREVRLRKARILQAVNMEKEEREVWYVIDTGEVLAVG